MSESNIVSIICSIAGVIIAIASLVVSILIFKSQRKFEKTIAERDKEWHDDQVQRDENKYIEAVKSQALEFIQRYNVTDEIQLLALCVIATKYNSTFPYRRQIYKDFCCLNSNVQKEVLTKMNIDLRLINIESINFYENTLKTLEQDLKEYYPENLSFFSDYFYDNGKYYYRSLEKHKNEKVPDYIYSERKCFHVSKPIPYRYKDLVADVLGKIDDKIELVNGDIINPKNIDFDALFMIQTSDGTAAEGKEIVMCYLQCLIANFVPMNLTNYTTDFINIGYYNEFFNKDNYYMEDLFLESLLSINIYKKVC